MDAAAHTKMLLAGVQRLTAPYTAPYYEQACRAALHQWLADVQCQPRCDSFGNTWVHLRRGKPQAQVAFVAHLDHPALQVDDVNGRAVRCSALGGLPTIGVEGAPVVFPFSQGAKAMPRGSIHSCKSERLGGRARLRESIVRLDKASAVPTVGDVGVFDLPACTQRGHRLKLRVADDLLGCAAIVGAIDLLQRHRHNPCDVVGLFTRAEEVGLQGALAIAESRLLPVDTWVISVECSKAHTPFALGRGPVVRFGDRAGPFTPAVCALTRAAARALPEDVAYQEGAMVGGTCEATAFLAFGYACAGVALPLANYHNQGPRGVAPEEIDLRDLHSATHLLAAIAQRVASGGDDMKRLRDEMLFVSEHGRKRLQATASARFRAV